MVENADSIAMSFDSARWTFISRSSCSILSKVRFDKSFSGSVSGRDCRRLRQLTQRHTHHIGTLATIRNTSSWGIPIELSAPPIAPSVCTRFRARFQPEE